MLLYQRDQFECSLREWNKEEGWGGGLCTQPLRAKNVRDASITTGETEADVLHDPASPVDQSVNAEEGLFVTITGKADRQK